MDGCRDESAAIHSLTRKRKADSDQEQSSPSPDIQPPDSNVLDHSATPRIPASNHGHRLVSSWQPSKAVSQSVESAFAVRVRQEGPSRPKRPRIEIPQSIPSSPRRLRRGRPSYNSILSSPRRYARHPRLTEIRDTGVVSAIEPRRPGIPVLCPGSLSPSLSSPLLSNRTSHSLPVTPIEPASPHVPPLQPPINRVTLKELDLEAILRNPQLRQFASLSPYTRSADHFLYRP